MNILCTADKANTAHSISMRIDGFVRRFDYFGMRGKAQVIVGTKVQHFFPIHSDLRPLFAGNDPFFFHQTGSVDLFQFLAYAGYKFFVHTDKLSGKGREYRIGIPNINQGMLNGETGPTAQSGSPHL